MDQCGNWQMNNGYVGRGQESRVMMERAMAAAEAAATLGLRLGNGHPQGMSGLGLLSPARNQVIKPQSSLGT